MKALAASSIGQYEQSVAALGDYARTVELGLGACFRQGGMMAKPSGVMRGSPPEDIGAVVFGSDQGLVGRFNEIVVEHAIAALAALPGSPRVWAVGERVHARLADAGVRLSELYAVPSSVQAITPLVGQILIAQEAGTSPGRATELHLFYNRPSAAGAYAPVSQPAAAAGRKLEPRARPRSLANRPAAGGNGVRRGDPAGAHPRVSVRLALSGMCRVPGERERQPPGGDGTRRPEYRRSCCRVCRARSTACARAVSTRNCSTWSLASRH